MINPPKSEHGEILIEIDSAFTYMMYNIEEIAGARSDDLMRIYIVLIINAWLIGLF